MRLKESPNDSADVLNEALDARRTGRIYQVKIKSAFNRRNRS
jgi:hypothetical protein